MKTAGRLLTLLLAALTLAATFGCALMPSASGGGGTDRAASTPLPATTAVPTEEAKEDDLIEVRTLYADLYRTLVRAETAVVYNDPAVGSKLRASSTLEKDGETLTYRAKVDRLNPADAERFVTEETLDPIVGTADEIRANYAGLFVWDRVATGLVLSTPDFTFENLVSPEIVGEGEKTLTASVPDERLSDFFGIALEGISDLSIAVVYADAAINSLTLEYAQNGVPVKVTVTYAY